MSYSVTTRNRGWLHNLKNRRLHPGRSCLATAASLELNEKLPVFSMNKLFLRLKAWLKGAGVDMGDALLHPFEDDQPPEIGVQPYKDSPYDGKKGEK